MRWALAIAALLLAGCSGQQQELPGDPERGRQALQAYGCGSCHVVPGVAGADGRVGPPLRRIGSRVYIAGVLPNTPENMVLWIQAPQAVDPRSAMPDLQVNEKDARDIAAYFYSLP
jgi:cytochrome c